MSSPSVASMSSGRCSIDDCNLFRHFLEGQVAVREHILQDLRFSQFFSLPIVLYVCQKLWHWRERKSKTKKKTWCYEGASHSLVPWWKKSFYVLTQMLVLIQFERGWPIQTRGKMLRCVRKIISNKIWIWSNILLECADFINLGMWQFQIFTTNQLGRRF